MTLFAPRGTPAYAAEVGLTDTLRPAEVLFEAETVQQEPELLAVVASFERAAEAAMFSAHPASSTVSLRVIPSLPLSGNGLRRIWWVEGVQMGAWRVLLNMLDTMHHQGAPLKSVRLICTEVSNAKLAWHDAMRLPFPQRSNDLPFTLNVDRSLEDTGDPLFRLAFLRDIDDAAVKTVAALFQTWDSLVVRGGFLRSLDDRASIPDLKESLASQQTYAAAPDTIEHLLYEEVGDPSGFDAIVNMAVKLDLVFARVSSLDIG